MRNPDTLSLLVLVCVLLGVHSSHAVAQSYTIPPILEAGSSAIIEGQFDGDPSNTVISVNGTRAIVEDESSGSCTFTVPGNVLGHQSIDLQESGSRFSVPVVVLDINPALERTNLSRGETTRMSLEVRGVGALDSHFDIRIRNESPEQISVDDRDSVRISIAPGRDTTAEVRIKAKQTGDFEISYELAPEKPRVQFAESPSGTETEADSVSKPACGGIKGKVINKTKFAFSAIVVHVTSKCDLCEPKPPCPDITVTFSGDGAQPSFFVIPAGCAITLVNGYEKEIDELARIVPNPEQEKPRTLDIDILGPGDSATVTPTRTGRFLIDSDIHQFTDGYMFVASSSCYSVADSAGNYYIGELHPGEYTLEVFTQNKKTEFPKATVTVRANEVTTQDFVLERK